MKRYCSRHMIGEEIEYLRLFDALDSMEVYDDDELKQRLAVRIWFVDSLL